MEDIFNELLESINEELGSEQWKKEIENEVMYLIKNAITNNFTKSDVSKLIKKISEVSKEDECYYTGNYV